MINYKLSVTTDIILINFFSNISNFYEYICIVLFSHKFKLENCIRINNSFERTCKDDSAVIDRDNFNAHAHSYKWFAAIIASVWRFFTLSRL